MKKYFDIVVAMDFNRGIGTQGKLPWVLPPDLKYFKQLTATTSQPIEKNAVIMGRKTWESLPVKFRPLPNRVNFVLTQNKFYSVPKGVLLLDSFDFFGEKMMEVKEVIEKIFVIGGSQIFNLAVNHPNCHIIYVTQIFQNFDCDTFFPPLSHEWVKKSESPRFQYQSIQYSFLEFIKQKDNL